MTSNEPRPPLLLVLAHGVGEREFAVVRPLAGAPLAPPCVVALPDRPVRSVLGELDATAELRDLGIAVDRRTLLLRPIGRTDATAAERLGDRCLGPAPVTLFESTGVLAAAQVGGSRAAAVASGELGALLGRLAARLRRGDGPEIWFVGLGTAEPVHTTIDVAPAVMRRLPAPWASEIAARTYPGALVITVATHAAREQAAHALGTAPFAAWGTVHLDGAEVRLRARPGIAFGRRHLAARAPHAAAGVASAPLSAGPRAGSTGFADWIARFWMRAAALHLPAATASLGPAPAATPTSVRTPAIDDALLPAR